MNSKLLATSALYFAVAFVAWIVAAAIVGDLDDNTWLTAAIGSVLIAAFGTFMLHRRGGV